MQQALRLAVVGSLLIGLASVPALAGVEVFVHVDGIKGGAQVAPYTDWIEADSVSFGGTQSGNFHVGGGRAAGKPSFDGLTITKGIDRASPLLFELAAEGRPVGKVEVHVRASSARDPLFTYELRDAIVVAVHSGAGRELVTFGFAELTQTGPGGASVRLPHASYSAPGQALPFDDDLDTLVRVDFGWGETDAHGFGVAIVSRSSVQAGTGDPRSAGAEFQDVRIARRMDGTSPQLLDYLARGDVLPEVTVRLCGAADKSDHACRVSILLESVVISSVSTELGGDEAPEESLTLSYGKLRFEYTPVDHQDEQEPDPVTFAWDIAANEQQ